MGEKIKVFIKIFGAVLVSVAAIAVITGLVTKMVTPVGVGAIAFVISLSVSAFIYFTIEEKISALSKVREYLYSFANTDFSKKVDIEPRDPVMERVVGDLNEISVKLGKVMSEIKDKTRDADLSEKGLKETFANLMNALEEIKASSDKQAESYNIMITNFEGVTGGVQEIASAANVAATTSSKTLELTSQTVNLATTGMENVQESLIKMGEIKENTDRTAESVAKLEKLANDIGGIVGSITKISEQTNLLALNAAIEAARAGEAGKGFAVVAQEIRGLADESRKAAGTINDIVTVIQTETKQAVEKMNKTSIVVTDGSEISTSVGESLSVMLDSINQINEMMADVAAGAQQQSANTHEIADKMDKITQLINEDNSIRKQAESAIENAETITYEVKNKTARLSTTITEINELTDKIKTR